LSHQNSTRNTRITGNQHEKNKPYLQNKHHLKADSLIYPAFDAILTDLPRFFFPHYLRNQCENFTLTKSRFWLITTARRFDPGYCQVLLHTHVVSHL